MAEFEFSVQINRPVEQVFAFTENPANMPLWYVGVQEAALIEGDKVTVGARVRGTGTLMGKRFEVISTVVAYEPNRKSAYEFTQPFAQTIYNTYEPVNGGTRFTQRVVVEAGGFFKLAMPVMNGHIRRNLETSLHNLKDVVEAQG